MRHTLHYYTQVLWRLLRLVLPRLSKRLALGLLAALLLATTVMYSISAWYAHTQANKPLVYGVSFIPAYAESLGLNAQETMDALLDINVRHFRLVSYWNQLEPAPGQYDFSLLDWQFAKAEKAGAHITLTLGLRQPRWPECHAPEWVNMQGHWQPQLYDFMTKVIERYKDSPALADYQLENEYFLRGFGNCTDFSRSRLLAEYNLVRRLDPGRSIVIARSNNALGTPIGQPTPDEFSVSVYKRVWDAGVTHRYLEYPFPAWYYGFLAGVQKLTRGKPMRIAELQAEAWPPHGQPIAEVSLTEQNKSMNAARLKARFDYGRGSGLKRVDLWGGEYWYYRLVKLQDPSLWNVAKQEFSANP
ncbi:beta-galactosidase [Candidatus Saccharibacteria bacterium]|nr:beta-galactosidase [Candidatus Saccharibacteria bacterium]